MSLSDRGCISVVLITMLSACGKDSGIPLPSTNTNPAGYYTGTLVSNTSGSSVEVVALAADDGEFRIIDPATGAQYIGALSFSDDTLEPALAAHAAPGATFPDKSLSCSGHLQGTLQPGTGIVGSYSCGGDSGRLSLLYSVDDSLQEPSDRFPIIGVHGDITPGDVLFLALQRDGSLTGSDSTGCTYTGQMTVIDPFINIYSMDLHQDCKGRALTLDGLASFGFVPNTANQAVYLALSNGSHSLVGVLLYQ